MNRPATVPVGQPELPDDDYRPIREAIAGLCAGSCAIAEVEAAIVEVLYRDLHQAVQLRSLLDDAHREGSLDRDDHRRLTTELRRLVTEEVPTDGIPLIPQGRSKEEPTARKAPFGAGTLLANRYQLEECVAQGPLSDVYRAGDRWRAELGVGRASVALKVLEPADDGIIDRDRLRRQALLAQQLAHPNICRVFGVERDGDTDFVVAEWLEGETLASLMDRTHPGPLDPALLGSVIEATAAALQHAESVGLVHGDLKPANVFVCSDGVIKLLDFALERGEPGAPAMTREYASCEILEGRAREPADDVYAFAVMIYRALTGSRPFGRRSALVAEADGAQAEPVPGLDEKQWASLERAMAFRRADRDIDAAQLAARLTRSAAASTAARHEIPGRPGSGRLLIALLVAAAGIAVVASGWPKRALERWQAESRPVSVASAVGPDGQAESVGQQAPPASELPADPVPDVIGGIPAGDEPFQAVPVESVPIIVRPDDAGPIEPETTADDSIGAEPETGELAVSVAAEPSEPEQAPLAETAAPEAPQVVAPALPASGGGLGFRNDLYEANESDGFVTLQLRAPARHPGLRLLMRAGAGSAELGSDFALSEKLVEIEPGRTRTEVLWPLVDDARKEYLEDVELLLESLNDDYPVTRADALVIIFDDDGPAPDPTGASLP